MNNKIEYPVINLKATGERICQLRKARGIKVLDISEYMGFSEPQAVYKWQRGECLPTLDNLFALSKLFATPMEDILVCEDGMSSVFYPLFKLNYRFILKRVWDEYNKVTKQGNGKADGGGEYVSNGILF